MIKPAAQATKSGVIAVCATPTTLASERYNYLKRTYASDITVLEPDCSMWAKLIEQSEINERHIRETLAPCLLYVRMLLCWAVRTTIG